VFRCPEGLAPEEWDGQSGTGSGSYGLYPTDPKNNGYVYGVAPNPRADGAPPYGVATWYQVNSRITGYTSNMWPGGGNAAPFMYFDKTKNGPPGVGTTMAGQFQTPGYTRTLSMIRRSAQMAMVVEAAAVNWVDNGAQTNNGETNYIARLGARHGKKTANGANANLNFAFFDGHVALYPSVMFNTPPAGSQFPQDNFKSGTIFWLGHQK
jgi:prepilin-type processing-associated H-X9-DG protein